MRNSIKTIVIATISVIGILFTQACKKETDENQAPTIKLAGELQPEDGEQYVVVDSGMALHLQFTATDDNGLSSGTVHVFTTTGETLYDTTLSMDNQTLFLFHQHYYPVVAETTYATVAITVTNNLNLTSTDSVLVELLP